MLIAQICHFGNDGDAYYRLHEPSRHLGQIDGVSAVDCHFLSRHLPELVQIADVLVLQFLNDWEVVSICQRRRQAGRLTIFEANDYFFDLQPWNPIAVSWAQPTIRQLYLQLLKLADGVQTSSEELAQRWRQRGASDVAVFHNQLSQVAPLPPDPNRPLTIGWAGSPGHLADWYALAPALQQWLAVHQEVQLAVMCTEPARAFFDLPPSRYRFVPFSSMDQYRQFLSTVDIGLAPLLPTDYNRCRSDVKFLEYASAGVVGIYADREPYRDSIADGQTGLLYRSTHQLLQQLDLLAGDPAFRQRLRRQGYEHVAQNRRIEDHISRRLEWYQSLSRPTASPPTVSLPSHIAESAQRQQGYYQLLPQESEGMLMAALAEPKAAGASEKLQLLLQRQPRYLEALYRQGRALNDLRDHHGALAVLGRAGELGGDTARIRAEIGRAHFLLGDRQLAREHLEKAIELNWHFLPAWQYLLRLLTIHPAADGPDWARQAMELFADCHATAMLAAGIFPSEQVVGVLRQILETHAARLPSFERWLVMPNFVKSLLSTIPKDAHGTDVIDLLGRACEIFPESPALSAHFASVLHRSGDIGQAHAQYARALDLHRAAAVVAAEGGGEKPAPFIWQLASHILQATPFSQNGDHCG